MNPAPHSTVNRQMSLHHMVTLFVLDVGVGDLENEKREEEGRSSGTANLLFNRARCGDQDPFQPHTTARKRDEEDLQGASVVRTWRAPSFPWRTK